MASPSIPHSTRRRATPTPAPAVTADATGSAQRAHVVKKLSPTQRGTARWLRRYGKALLCVRYRLDPRTGVRYTTVELVVETRRSDRNAHAQVLLPIDFCDQATRQRAIDLGAKWKRRERAWLMTLATAIQLGLVPPTNDPQECP